MWRAVEGQTAPFQLGHGEGDIGAAKINAAALGAGYVVGFFQQQTDAGAIEKGQRAKAIKLPQSEHRLVERFGAVDVADWERDLADLVEIEQHGIGPESLFGPHQDE